MFEGKVLNKILLAGFFFLLIPGSPAFSDESSVQRWAVGMESRTELVVTEDLIFPAKLQPGVGLWLTCDWILLPRLRVGTAAGFHWTGGSNLAGGFLYRAYNGFDLRVYASLLGQAAPSSTLVFGFHIGPLARLDRYSRTLLYFFYPGVYVHPFLEGRFRDSFLDRWTLGFPVELYFRKDLKLSLSAGIGLNLTLYPGNRRKTEGQP
jgi:hypothetical protein